jgi:hypothetical protein
MLRQSVSQNQASRRTVGADDLASAVRLCAMFVLFERGSMDNPTTPVTIPPALRSQLRQLWPTLQSLKPLVHELDQGQYQDKLGILLPLVFNETYVQMKGQAHIDCLVGSDVHISWWVCQARIRGKLTLEGSARRCDQIAKGDEMQMCSRVSRTA